MSIAMFYCFNLCVCCDINPFMRLVSQYILKATPAPIQTCPAFEFFNWGPARSERQLKWRWGELDTPEKAFSGAAPGLWNFLRWEIRQAPSLLAFRWIQKQNGLNVLLIVDNPLLFKDVLNYLLLSTGQWIILRIVIVCSLVCYLVLYLLTVLIFIYLLFFILSYLGWLSHIRWAQYKSIQ